MGSAPSRLQNPSQIDVSDVRQQRRRHPASRQTATPSADDFAEPASTHPTTEQLHSMSKAALLRLIDVYRVRLSITNANLQLLNNQADDIRVRYQRAFRAHNSMFCYPLQCKLMSVQMLAEAFRVHAQVLRWRKMEVEMVHDIHEVDGWRAQLQRLEQELNDGAGDPDALIQVIRRAAFAPDDSADAPLHPSAAPGDLTAAPSNLPAAPSNLPAAPSNLPAAAHGNLPAASGNLPSAAPGNLPAVGDLQPALQLSPDEEAEIPDHLDDVFHEEDEEEELLGPITPTSNDGERPSFVEMFNTSAHWEYYKGADDRESSKRWKNPEKLQKNITKATKYQKNWSFSGPPHPPKRVTFWLLLLFPHCFFYLLNYLWFLIFKPLIFKELMPFPLNSAMSIRRGRPLMIWVWGRGQSGKKLSRPFPKKNNFQKAFSRKNNLVQIFVREQTFLGTFLWVYMRKKTEATPRKELNFKRPPWKKS